MKASSCSLGGFVSFFFRLVDFLDFDTRFWSGLELVRVPVQHQIQSYVQALQQVC